MDEWYWNGICQSRTHDRAVRAARDGGWQGTLPDLELAAHREMYARTGDDIHLARMLRHVA